MQINRVMKNTKLSGWGIAACVIGSIIGTGFFSNRSRRSNRYELFDQQQRVLDQNLTTPANGAFAIWSLIYSGTAGLVIHQALPSQQNNLRYQKARPWWLANYALNALFGYFFSSSNKMSRVGSGLTTIAMLPTALGLHRTLEIDRPADVPQPERSLRRAVSLYAGWLTVATVVSAGNLLIEAGLRVSRRQGERWAYGILPVTTALGITIARRLNDPYYLAPFVVGFGGITAKQWGKSNGVATLAGACALTVAVAGGRQWQVSARQSVEQTNEPAQSIPVEVVAENSAQPVDIVEVQ